MYTSGIPKKENQQKYMGNLIFYTRRNGTPKGSMGELNASKKCNSEMLPAYFLSFLFPTS